MEQEEDQEFDGAGWPVGFIDFKAGELPASDEGVQQYALVMAALLQQK